MTITLAQNPYYTEMLHKNRLFPFAIKQQDDLLGFITFYITDEPQKYLMRDNLWSIEKDNPEGNFCTIDQLWTNKSYNNSRLSYKIWHGFKDYIKENFRNVQYIRWNRWKNGKVYIFSKEIKSRNRI